MLGPYFKLGHTEFKKGCFEEAVKQFEKALHSARGSNPNRKELYRRWIALTKVCIQIVAGIPRENLYFERNGLPRIERTEPEDTKGFTYYYHVMEVTCYEVLVHFWGRKGEGFPFDERRRVLHDGFCSNYQATVTCGPLWHVTMAVLGRVQRTEWGSAYTATMGALALCNESTPCYQVATLFLILGDMASWRGDRSVAIQKYQLASAIASTDAPQVVPYADFMLAVEKRELASRPPKPTPPT